MIGCIVYASAEVREPGVVTHVHGGRFELGEPDGSTSDRVLRLAEVIVAAGLEAPVLSNIRDGLSAR